MRYVRLNVRIEPGDTLRVTTTSLGMVVELNERQLTGDEFEIRDDAVERSGWKEGTAFHWTDINRTP